MLSFYVLSNSPAECIPADDGSVQLINACSAAHWFDLKAFFSEANRVLSPNGVIALSCHDIPHQQFVHPTKGDELRLQFEKVNRSVAILIVFSLNDVNLQTYCETFRPFWGEGNSIVIREYADIEFPYPDFIRYLTFSTWKKNFESLPTCSRNDVWAEEELTTLKDIGSFLATTAPFQNCIKQRGQQGADDLLNDFFSK